MPKYLVRIVALLLVPCLALSGVEGLAADPVLAFALSRPVRAGECRSVSEVSSQAPFQREAFELALIGERTTRPLAQAPHSYWIQRFAGNLRKTNGMTTPSLLLTAIIPASAGLLAAVWKPVIHALLSAIKEPVWEVTIVAGGFLTSIPMAVAVLGFAFYLMKTPLGMTNLAAPHDRNEGTRSEGASPASGPDESLEALIQKVQGYADGGLLSYDGIAQMDLTHTREQFDDLMRLFRMTGVLQSPEKQAAFYYLLRHRIQPRRIEGDPWKIHFDGMSGVHIDAAGLHIESRILDALRTIGQGRLYDDLDQNLSLRKSPIPPHVLKVLHQLCLYRILAPRLVTGNEFESAEPRLGQFPSSIFTHVYADGAGNDYVYDPAAGKFVADPEYRGHVGSAISAQEYAGIRAHVFSDFMDKQRRSVNGEINAKRRHGVQVTLKPIRPMDYRDSMVPIFEKTMKKRNLLKRFEISKGGSTSIDVRRRGVNKGSPVRHARAHLPPDAVIFFLGDEMLLEGKDEKDAGVDDPVALLQLEKGFENLVAINTHQDRHNARLRPRLISTRDLPLTRDTLGDKAFGPDAAEIFHHRLLNLLEDSIGRALRDAAGFEPQPVLRILRDEISPREPAETPPDGGSSSFEPPVLDPDKTGTSAAARATPVQQVAALLAQLGDISGLSFTGSELRLIDQIQAGRTTVASRLAEALGVRPQRVRQLAVNILEELRYEKERRARSADAMPFERRPIEDLLFDKNTLMAFKQRGIGTIEALLSHSFRDLRESGGMSGRRLELVQDRLLWEEGRPPATLDTDPAPGRNDQRNSVRQLLRGLELQAGTAAYQMTAREPAMAPAVNAAVRGSVADALLHDAFPRVGVIAVFHETARPLEPRLGSLWARVLRILAVQALHDTMDDSQPSLRLETGFTRTRSGEWQDFLSVSAIKHGLPLAGPRPNPLKNPCVVKRPEAERASKLARAVFLVELAGGSITREAGQGTTFTIRFPTNPSPEQRQGFEARQKPPIQPDPLEDWKREMENYRGAWGAGESTSGGAWGIWRHWNLTDPRRNRSGLLWGAFFEGLFTLACMGAAHATGHNLALAGGLSVVLPHWLFGALNTDGKVARTPRDLTAAIGIGATGLIAAPLLAWSLASPSWPMAASYFLAAVGAATLPHMSLQPRPSSPLAAAAPGDPGGGREGDSGGIPGRFHRRRQEILDERQTKLLHPWQTERHRGIRDGKVGRDHADRSALEVAIEENGRILDSLRNELQTFLRFDRWNPHLRLLANRFNNERSSVPSPRAGANAWTLRRILRLQQEIIDDAGTAIRLHGFSSPGGARVAPPQTSPDPMILEAIAGADAAQQAVDAAGQDARTVDLSRLSSARAYLKRLRQFQRAARSTEDPMGRLREVFKSLDSDTTEAAKKLLRDPRCRFMDWVTLSSTRLPGIPARRKERLAAPLENVMRKLDALELDRLGVPGELIRASFAVAIEEMSGQEGEEFLRAFDELWSRDPHETGITDLSLRRLEALARSPDWRDVDARGLLNLLFLFGKGSDAFKQAGAFYIVANLFPRSLLNGFVPPGRPALSEWNGRRRSETLMGADPIYLRRALGEAYDLTALEWSALEMPLSPHIRLIPERTPAPPLPKSRKGPAVAQMIAGMAVTLAAFRNQVMTLPIHAALGIELAGLAAAMIAIHHYFEDDTLRAWRKLKTAA